MLYYDDVYEKGVTIGRNLKFIGNLDMDFMQSANGKYCVLELNPHFDGSPHQL